MANVDFPRGFQPIRRLDSGNFDLQSNLISSSNTAIGKYDLLELRSDGFTWPAQAGSVTIVGVAAEAVAANTGGSINYYPTDGGLVLRAQVDDATVDAQTDLGLNYDIVATGPASTGISQMEIDGSTQATTATLPIKVLKVETVVTPTGNVLGANVVVECIVNQSAYKGTGAIAV
jgi:hypothetical protein